MENLEGERNTKVGGIRKCSEGGRMHVLSKPGTALTRLGCICDVMRMQIHSMERRNKEKSSLSFNSKAVTSGNIRVQNISDLFPMCLMEISSTFQLTSS